MGVTWKSILFLILFESLGGCAGRSTVDYYQRGMASWYGKRFHGRKTASGEPYNMNQMTAAHRSLPFGTQVRVIREATGESVVVRINDRGPYAQGRIIDLSKSAARALGFLKKGEAKVRLVLIP